MTITDWATRHGISPQALTELYDVLNPWMGTIPGTDGETSEADTQSRLRVEAPRQGCALWRNNNGAYEDGTGRWVRYGLGNDSKKLNEVWKSSDLIGITRMTSTAIGQVFGVFTAVEVKHPGWTKPANKRDRAQAAFHTSVRGLGGIGMFATSVNDYRGIFR